MRGITVMRKDIVLPSLAVAGGLAGFLLRRWQLASAYRPEVGLFVHGAPATWVLLWLTGLLVLAFALLVQEPEKHQGPEDFLPAFGCPETGQMTLLTAAGLLMMAAGALGLKDGLSALQLWREMPQAYQLSIPGAQLLTGALCLPAGLGVLLMGKAAYRGELDGSVSTLASFPALTGVVWLFTSHLNNGTEPVLMKYGFQLAAICLLTLAHYYIAAFFFDRPHRRKTAFLCLLGAVLAIIALADSPSLFTAAGLLAFSLSALGFARVLLRNTFGPPWPKRLISERMPPVEEEDTDNA